MSLELTSLLAAIPLFQGFDPAGLANVASKLERVHLRGGQTIFHAGEVADCMYVVIRGRLRATVPVEDGFRVIGEIGRGDTLGEMALLTGGKRSATVRAIRDSELFRLSEGTFAQMMEESPKALLAITRRIVGHYQSVLSWSLSSTTPRISTLVLIPLGAEVDVGALAGRLAGELGAERALTVSSQSVDAELGPGTAQIPFDHSRNGELLDHLNNLESRHRVVIYLADGEPSTWTSRCARQADRVLLVAHSGTDPRPRPVERLLAEEGATHAPFELVLVHPHAKESYPDTKSWLAPRRLERYHHLASDSAADLTRLVRLLSGRATGLVLGGGGARGFAQIGVVRALQECGCVADVIGGTSWGAYLGAQLASGWAIDRIRDFNRECFTKLRPLRDFTLPYVSLLSGRKFMSVIQRIYGEADIEDLPISFYCCTSNLTRATNRVCRSGSLYRWLASSLAVPGVAPPVPFDGDLYVDGAMLDNLPVDVMAEICPGVIVAVDVTPVEELRVDLELREPPSGWSLARRSLLPGAPPRMPTIFEVLGRATALASIRQLAEMKKLADLYLHPPVEPYTMFDWERVDELMELGYRYAKPLVEGWLAAREQRRSEEAIA